MAIDMKLINAIGSIAPIIASFTAIWITWYLGRNPLRIAEVQKATAKSQRDIAYDKLKFDLFKHRYEIYVAARDIYKRIESGTSRPTTDPELFKMLSKVDEALFFFPAQEVSLFKNIDDLAISYEEARASWERNKENDKERIEQGKAMSEAMKGLKRLYQQLPDLVKDELGFPQLISRREDRA